MIEGRLIFLSDYFGEGGAATGGAGIAALASYEAVRGAGADCSLLAGYHLSEHLFGRLDATLLGGVDLRAGGRIKSAAAIYNPDSRRRVEAALAAFDPETTVIVLHQWTRCLSPSVIGLLRRFKLMVYMHDYFWACPNGAYYDFKQVSPCTRAPLGLACLTAGCDRAGRAQKALRVVRQVVKSAVTPGDPSQRLMLSISTLARRTAEQLLPNEAHALIHNPMPDLSQVASPALAEETYDVGYFGRLEPEKGVGDLMRVLQANGRRCLFVGAGSMEAELRATLGAASVIGWADRDRVTRLMLACRLVALPSRWSETWGLVIAEALAQGRPVVVSHRAGSAELVERFGGGAQFDPDDPLGLERAISQVLDGGWAQGAAATAAPLVREALSSGAHGQRMIDLAADRWGLDVRRSDVSRSAAELQPCAM